MLTPPGDGHELLAAEEEPSCLRTGLWLHAALAPVATSPMVSQTQRDTGDGQVSHGLLQHQLDSGGPLGIRMRVRVSG
jgi:hypothetical protein